MRRIVALLICLTFLFSLGGISSATMKVYYYHTDPSGTPMAVSDSSGNIVWRATYKPFGQEQSVSGSIQNNERFIGKEKDKETGLVYINHRYYMPEIGRFISPDSVTLVNPWTSKVNMKVLLNPQLLNRYAYGLNNPYKYVDPNGQFIFTTIAIGAGLLTLGEWLWPQTMGSPHQDSFMAQHSTDILMMPLGIEEVGGEAAEEVFETAKAGGRYSGLLRNYESRSTGEIQSALDSYEKQVSIHIEKIENPAQFAERWGSMSEQEQQGLLRKWTAAIQRNRAQANVMRGILKERGGLP